MQTACGHGRGEVRPPSCSGSRPLFRQPACFIRLGEVPVAGSPRAPCAGRNRFRAPGDGGPLERGCPDSPKRGKWVPATVATSGSPLVASGDLAKISVASEIVPSNHAPALRRTKEPLPSVHDRHTLAPFEALITCTVWERARTRMKLKRLPLVIVVGVGLGTVIVGLTNADYRHSDVALISFSIAVPLALFVALVWVTFAIRRRRQRFVPHAPTGPPAYSSLALFGLIPIFESLFLWASPHGWVRAGLERLNRAAPSWAYSRLDVIVGAGGILGLIALLAWVGVSLARRRWSVWALMLFQAVALCAAFGVPEGPSVTLLKLCILPGAFVAYAILLGFVAGTRQESRRFCLTAVGLFGAALLIHTCAALVPFARSLRKVVPLPAPLAAAWTYDLSDAAAIRPGARIVGAEFVTQELLAVVVADYREPDDQDDDLKCAGSERPLTSSVLIFNSRTGGIVRRRQWRACGEVVVRGTARGNLLVTAGNVTWLMTSAFGLQRELKSPVTVLSPDGRLAAVRKDDSMVFMDADSLSPTGTVIRLDPGRSWQSISARGLIDFHFASSPGERETPVLHSIDGLSISAIKAPFTADYACFVTDDLIHASTDYQLDVLGISGEVFFSETYLDETFLRNVSRNGARMVVITGTFGVGLIDAWPRWGGMRTIVYDTHSWRAVVTTPWEQGDKQSNTVTPLSPDGSMLAVGNGRTLSLYALP